MNTKHILATTFLASTLFSTVPCAWAQHGHDRRRESANTVTAARRNNLANRGSNNSQSTKQSPSVRKSGGDNSESTESIGKLRTDASSQAAKAQSSKTHVSEITVTKTVDASSPN